MVLWLLLIISSLFAIEFDFNTSSEIIVEVDGQILTNPFSGGLNQPKVQWIDWDEDGDSDLFIMDADNNLRFYQNDSDNDEFIFTLITTQFYGISSGGWFFFGDFNNDDVLDLVVQDAEILNNVRYYQLLDNLFISIGGGGLISGISAVIKHHSPKTKIWGVSAINSCTLADSIKAGRMIETKHF